MAWFSLKDQGRPYTKACCIYFSSEQNFWICSLCLNVLRKGLMPIVLPWYFKEVSTREIPTLNGSQVSLSISRLLGSLHIWEPLQLKIWLCIAPLPSPLLPPLLSPWYMLSLPRKYTAGSCQWGVMGDSCIAGKKQSTGVLRIPENRNSLQRHKCVSASELQAAWEPKISFF